MAALYPLSIDQGADFPLLLRWKGADGVPADLTGWSAAMQVRSTTDSTTVLLNLSSPSGGIVLGADGTIRVKVTAAQSRALVRPADAEMVTLANRKRAFVLGYYDLEITAPVSLDSTVIRLVEGQVLLSPETTR